MTADGIPSPNIDFYPPFVFIYFLLDDFLAHHLISFTVIISTFRPPQYWFCVCNYNNPRLFFLLNQTDPFYISFCMSSCSVSRSAGVLKPVPVLTLSCLSLHVLPISLIYFPILTIFLYGRPATMPVPPPPPSPSSPSPILTSSRPLILVFPPIYLYNGLLFPRLIFPLHSRLTLFPWSLLFPFLLHFHILTFSHRLMTFFWPFFPPNPEAHIFPQAWFSWYVCDVCFLLV